MTFPSAAREPYAADARRLGGDLAPGTTWEQGVERTGDGCTGEIGTSVNVPNGVANTRPSAERPVWIIDHAAERLTQVLNQPVPVPHPHRRKSDEEKAA